MKFRYSLGIYLLMVMALPHPERFATPGGTGTWQNFLFMFGHANALHYLLNGFAWVMLWKVITWQRTLAAWCLSVLAASFLPPAEPVLGWSTVIYYYLGLCFSSMPLHGRLRLLLLSFLGFALPHIAAGIHMVMLLCGWMMRKVEVAWERTR